jgi:hypothetical protein
MDHSFEQHHDMSFVIILHCLLLFRSLSLSLSFSLHISLYVFLSLRLSVFCLCLLSLSSSLLSLTLSLSLSLSLSLTHTHTHKRTFSPLLLGILLFNHSNSMSCGLIMTIKQLRLCGYLHLSADQMYNGIHP